jgi:hypothetical protein
MNWTVPAALNGATRAIRNSGKDVYPGFGAASRVVVVGVIPADGVRVGGLTT